MGKKVYLATRDPAWPPTHPAAILRENVLPALEIGVTKAARHLGVSRQAPHRVRDLERSVRFYQDLLGEIVVYRDEDTVQLQTPGSRDVIVLEHRPTDAGKPGGVIYFGFRLKRASDIETARPRNRTFGVPGIRTQILGQIGPIRKSKTGGVAVATLRISRLRSGARWPEDRMRKPEAICAGP